MFCAPNVQDIDFEIYGFKLSNTEVRHFMNSNVSDRLQSFKNGNYSNDLLVSDDNGFVKRQNKTAVMRDCTSSLLQANTQSYSVILY